MPSAHEPNWQAVSQLPLVADMIDGMAESAEEQLILLNEAKDRPHVLDDATLDRVTAVYTQQRDDLWLYAEQLNRWKSAPSTDIQRTEIVRLETRLAGLRENITTLLALAAQYKPQTIDAILAKSDVELALELLSGKLQFPGRPSGSQPKTPRGKQK